MLKPTCAPSSDDPSGSVGFWLVFTSPATPTLFGVGARWLSRSGHRRSGSLPRCSRDFTPSSPE
ncbi:hypothetical protein SLEP1_g47181 [Rubroshorea leprosula]|uniref:Uncharacterized protein n=1 Tax=Rubroshorea leprosula TaxID=152421 RepID=A0AAV5LRU1_9ROSI|nr:hypothetical protein SLEP1_g47181 [Rubroshorea leprosula]